MSVSEGHFQDTAIKLFPSGIVWCDFYSLLFTNGIMHEHIY